MSNLPDARQPDINGQGDCPATDMTWRAGGIAATEILQAHPHDIVTVMRLGVSGAGEVGPVAVSGPHIVQEQTCHGFHTSR